MDSKIGEKKSQQKRVQITSKVKFDLDGSQHIDDTDESLGEISEFLEFSPIPKNASSSSIDSTGNGSTSHTKASSSTNKRYLR